MLKELTALTVNMMKLNAIEYGILRFLLTFMFILFVS